MLGLTLTSMETHPFPPYIPEDAKVLLMGTFPPQPKRWSMEFYYPNRTNDFWPMMGLLFLGDRKALFNADDKSFNLEAIKALLNEHGIALSDTGYKIRRLMDNASDKYLEIVEPVNLNALLERMPYLKAIGTTGEKAAGVLAHLTGTEPPRMGEWAESPMGIALWRLPSTSRAYPLALEKKAEYYRRIFVQAGVLE